MFDCAKFAVLLFTVITIKKSLEVETKQLWSPSIDFKRHTLVQPTVLHPRTKRKIKTTRDTAKKHYKEVTLNVNVEGEVSVIDLRLNEDLVAGDHVISYQKDGETVLHKPKKEELDNCQYSGTVRRKPGSWAAVSTCHGVRGVIYDGKKMKYIEPAQGNDINSQHFVYDHKDLNTNHRCGYNSDVTDNTDYDPHLMKTHLGEKTRDRSRFLQKRDTDEKILVRGPYNEGKLLRYLELVLVADNMEFRANGENLDTVHRQLKDVANIVNSLYAPLNISIALVGVVVWTENDAIQLSEDGDRTLSNFLRYRRDTLLYEIPNDNAHLLTHQIFKGGVVAKVLNGPICTTEFSGGVVSNHTKVVGLLATTIAHAIGHNFGMMHDDDNCECPDSKCIMSSSNISFQPTHWSSCSRHSLNLAFERGMDNCLRNKPGRLFDSPTCGNGFVEPGEQCDCGLRAEPACAACCEPRGCTLRANASCAAGACCDPTTCSLKRAGTLCRAAEFECDLPEFCDGHSEFCPQDVNKMGTTPCGNGKAYCVRGACSSHTDQCKLLWGTTGENADELCYTVANIKGSKLGNCGYKRNGSDTQYTACASEDAFCGLLQCRHQNDRLEFGMESVSRLSALYIFHKGSIVPCKTAMIDLGADEVDVGFVPDGAKCGENKMCLHQQCMSLENIRERIVRTESTVCPSDCSGHGVCNSEGNCHCDVGFAPPLCDTPGPGGSFDSGPASDTSTS